MAVIFSIFQLTYRYSSGTKKCSKEYAELRIPTEYAVVIFQHSLFSIDKHIDGLVQEGRNSSALARELVKGQTVHI